MEWIPKPVENILQQLEEAGFEGWCVGGCVRDHLLGRRPGDWDLTTSALPEETLALFGERAIPTGLQHGTVTIPTDLGPVELTTFRVDGEYQDHRRPDAVRFTCSLEEDLKRRDFTINAMAINRRGELRDPFSGREDLKAGLLRSVGEAERRFEEDALRILRGLRFSSALGFSIEGETARAIREKRELLREIAAERIWAEFSKLLCGPDAVETLRRFPEVVGVFAPELLEMQGFEQHNPHHCYTVWEHTLHAMEQVPGDLILRLTLLLHDMGKPRVFRLDETGRGHFRGHQRESAKMADGLLRRLRCDRKTRETVLLLVEEHDCIIERTESGLLHALHRFGEEDLRRLLAIKRADNLAQAPAYRGMQEEISRAEEILEKLLAEGACYSIKQLAVSGKDLLALGLRGEALGKALEALLEEVLSQRLPNQREALLSRLKERI